MKRSIISLAAAFLAFFQISANAQDTTVNPPSKESVDSVSYLLGISFASIIRGNSFGEIHEDAMLRGMHDFLKAEGSPGREGFDDQFEIAPSKMNDILKLVPFTKASIRQKAATQQSRRSSSESTPPLPDSIQRRPGSSTRS